jgi:hypothetical protein
MLISYLKLYYKEYSHIKDNKMILDNYFNKNQILLFIAKYDKKTDINSSISNNM